MILIIHNDEVNNLISLDTLDLLVDAQSQLEFIKTIKDNGDAIVAQFDFDKRDIIVPVRLDTKWGFSLLYEDKFAFCREVSRAKTRFGKNKIHFEVVWQTEGVFANLVEDVENYTYPTANGPRILSKITLFKSTPFISDDRFLNVGDKNAYRQFLLDNFQYTSFQGSYQRVEGVVRCPISYDDFLNNGYNYVMIENPMQALGSNNQLFFGYVHDFSYVNDGLTTFVWSIDILQTFNGKYTIGNQLVLQGHINEYDDKDQPLWDDIIYSGEFTPKHKPYTQNSIVKLVDGVVDNIAWLVVKRYPKAGQNYNGVTVVGVPEQLETLLLPFDVNTLQVQQLVMENAWYNSRYGAYGDYETSHTTNSTPLISEVVNQMGYDSSFVQNMSRVQSIYVIPSIGLPYTFGVNSKGQRAIVVDMKDITDSVVPGVLNTSVKSSADNPTTSDASVALFNLGTQSMMPMRVINNLEPMGWVDSMSLFQRFLNMYRTLPTYQAMRDIHGYHPPISAFTAPMCYARVSDGRGFTTDVSIFDLGNLVMPLSVKQMVGIGKNPSIVNAIDNTKDNVNTANFGYHYADEGVVSNPNVSIDFMADNATMYKFQNEHTLSFNYQQASIQQNRARSDLSFNQNQSQVEFGLSQAEFERNQLVGQVNNITGAISGVVGAGAQIVGGVAAVASGVGAGIGGAAIASGISGLVDTGVNAANRQMELENAAVRNEMSVDKFLRDQELAPQRLAEDQKMEMQRLGLGVKQAESNISPLSIGGNNNSFSAVYGLNNNQFLVDFKMPYFFDMEKAVNYYARYGYNYGSWEDVEVFLRNNKRVAYNYIKLSNCHVRQSDLPMSYVNRINERYNNGVTVIYNYNTYLYQDYTGKNIQSVFPPAVRSLGSELHLSVRKMEG